MAGPARFLHDLHKARSRAKGTRADAMVWRAVAGAPPGFCTPRSAMVGTLLDDIVAGLPFADVKRRFDAKMHPLQYQRPQVAPTAGNIAQAEKLVAELGLEPALHRRFARLDELRTLWRPAQAAHRDTSGVFGHLAPKSARRPAAMNVPPQPITWSKFVRKVLPTAADIEIHMDAKMNFGAAVTANDPEAPPILQWDREGDRNPFSLYVYTGGSAPKDWGLKPEVWVPVTAVALQPSLWAGEDHYPHHGKAALFVLEGAQDQRQGGLALFPETLRSDLHRIRAVVEAYSRSRQLTGREEASACGLIVGSKGDPAHIRVISPIGPASYRIDRWD